MINITEEEQKSLAAEAALSFLKPNMVLGVGTGSTVNCFIHKLKTINFPLKFIASSLQTKEQLEKSGFTVISANEVGGIDLYVDGTDEIDENFYMIKGGGKALTGEKILASMSKQFICIAQCKKKVKRLGSFPVPLEVIPMARSKVARKIVAMNGNPVYREGALTDYGNVILDIWNWKIDEPVKLEMELNQIPGIVTNGIFAQQKANILLLGTERGVETYTCV